MLFESVDRQQISMDKVTISTILLVLKCSRLHIPSFKVIAQLVVEKKIFKGFYNIYLWWPSWLCDQAQLYNFFDPLLPEAFT